MKISPRRISLMVSLMLCAIPILATAVFTAKTINFTGIGLRAHAAGLTPDETQADFDLMRKALEEAHTGLYRYSTKSQMDRMFDAQRVKLNRPMTNVEFLAVVSETLAQIRCGHTGAMPDAELQT